MELLRKPKARVPWLLVALLCSTAVNLGLGWKIRGIFAAAAAREPLVGQTITGFSALDGDGRTVQVALENQSEPTLLYVVRPGCGWCKRNMNNLKSLIAQSSGRYRVVVLSLTTDGNEEFQTTVPILSVQSESVRALRLGATPTTILVSPAGTVQGNWRGAYLPDTQKDIERTLGVTLPGVPVEAGAAGAHEK